MIYTMVLTKKKITIESHELEDFTPKMLNKMKKSNLVGLDLYLPNFMEDSARFNEEIQLIEGFLELKSGTIAKYLRKSYRPNLVQKGKTSIITLPYISTLSHVKDLSGEFIPIETSMDNFLILFQKPNKIVTIRTDPRNFSLECVSIVMNWIQQIEQSVSTGPNLLDQVIVRLIDEIVDDNVEVIRRFRANVEFLEQTIIRKSTESEVLDEVLKLKDISMHLYSYVLSEKRFLTRLNSAAFPGISLTDQVFAVLKITMKEIESQTGMINDINRMLSDIINLYSLMLQNHMNEVLKVLTIWSVIFLLPSLIVGFFGMNNFAIGKIDPIFSAVIAIILIIAIVVPLILLWKFKMFKRIGL